MTTAIIATSNARIEYLCWCLFSLAYRSKGLQHVIVSINGADSRYHDVSKQDEKEAFLNDFKAIAPFELSIIRTWSRVGFAQPIKMALPLVKTDTYVSLHDDLMILDSDWVQNGLNLLKTSEIACVWPKYRNNFDFSDILIFPRSNTQFVMARCEVDDWSEYFIQKEFEFSPDANFFANHEGCFNQILCEDGTSYLDNPPTRSVYKGCHIPPAYHLFRRKTSNFPQKTVLHFVEQSIKADGGIVSKGILLDEVSDLEKEIRRQNDFDLYSKYCHFEGRQKTSVLMPRPVTIHPSEFGPKILVCLGVYDRYFMAKHWLDAYSKSNLFNSRLMVLHHVGDNISTENQQMLQEHADWYVSKPNIGYGSGLLQYALNADIDWDVLLWSTDDTLPMKKDFIRLMTEPFKEDDVAITYPVWSASSEDKQRVRTNAFCIRRAAARNLKFMSSPILSKDEGRAFEYGPHSMQNQIQEAGLKVKMVTDAMRDFDWYHWEELSSWQEFAAEFEINADQPDFRTYKEEDNNIYLKQKTNWWDAKLDNADNMKWFHSGLAGSNSKSRRIVRDYIIGQGYKSMLDCGAGPCIDYANYKDLINYRAMDFADRWERNAKENGIPFLKSSIEAIAMPDNSVDVTYCRHVLEHLYFYEKAMNELIRVATKEVVVIFFNMDTRVSWDNTLIKDTGDEDIRFYNNQYSPVTVEKFARKNPKVQDVSWEVVREENDQIIMRIKLKEI